MKTNFIKKNWMKYLCTLLLCQASFFNLNAQSNYNTKKNVLIIMVDDLNDWVQGFGGNNQVKTPNISRLVNRSVVFQSAYCSAPICGPSRASIFTGQYPLTTTVYQNGHHFREYPGMKNIVTMPQYFNRFGNYRTVSAGKVFHVPRGYNNRNNVESDYPYSFNDLNGNLHRKGDMGTLLPQGVVRTNLTEKFNRTGVDLRSNNIVQGFKDQFDWAATVKDIRGNTQTLEKTEDYLSLDFVAKFIRNERNTQDRRPFFAACGTFRPHTPLYCPKEFYDLYKNVDIELPHVIANDLNDVKVSKNWSALHKAILDSKNGKSGISKWKDFVRAYMANISYVDACIGNLLDALDNNTFVKNNTIVVFVSDHGFSLGEKEYWTKPTLWEEISRVPMMIYDPSINGIQGKKINVNRVVSTVDLYPTLVDLAGLPKNNIYSSLDGVSLKPLMEKPTRTWNRIALTSRDKDNHTVRNQRFRYISKNGGYHQELYNHDVDPNEFNNLMQFSGGNLKSVNDNELNRRVLNVLRNALNTSKNGSKAARKRILAHGVDQTLTSKSVNRIHSNKDLFVSIKNKTLNLTQNSEFAANTKLYVYDLIGNKIIEKEFSGGHKLTINAKTLASQVYILKVVQNKGDVQIFKFINK
ncbi:hypothetical protein A8C32_15760 [Flavivirga aquatica]|uniref:Sulfatase N-terminal domain-containing protein n=1 Tax=Flavivirga aquatica TaxID=1849968 RepID=A0A1E5T971_9FLAO|nr:sulfatase [Flavivirga aquatica]OEK07930.1 hypothetical protein A8C32_15760 [Flavivirga aquatica]